MRGERQTTSGTNGAGMRSMEKQAAKGQRFSARRLALAAMFVALSFVVSFLEFPIFPVVGFLKLDFGNVFILLISFLLGPTEGVAVCACKELLRALVSNSGGVGELANWIATSAYILLPSLVYRRRKGLRVVLPCLAAACLIGTGAALLANRFLTFPMYLGESAATVFHDYFWWIAAFNLIKTASVGALTLLLYKRLSNFLKKKKI